MIVVLAAESVVNRYAGESVAEFVVILLGLKLASSLTSAALRGRPLVYIYSGLSAAERTLRTIAQVSFVVAGFGLTGMLI